MRFHKPSIPALLAAASCVLFLFATAAEAEWRQFRGPNGQGRLGEGSFPIRWKEQNGVVWKAAIPGRGWSSPVIAGNSIWLTTATQEGHSLRAVCVDADSGHVRHDVEVFAPAHPISINAKNSFASPSPIVEPGRVYVHFGAMGTACLDTNSGNVIWRNEDLVIDHKEGPGSSPILFENLLIVNCDGQDRQFVAALDKQSGRIVWETKRSADLTAKRPDFRKAFSTPALIKVDGRPQLVSTAADQVTAYDPRSGREIWHVRYDGFSNVPVPVVDGDRVYVVTDFSRPQLWAIRAGGAGDVTRTHVVWKLPRQVGASPSPILVDGRLYLMTDQGVATCVAAETGKLIWQRRIGGSFSASPVFLGGHVYFASEQGKVTVIEPADDCRILAENQLDGRFFASPAVTGRALILRTDTHLYRIEGAPTAASASGRAENATSTTGRASGPAPR